MNTPLVRSIARRAVLPLAAMAMAASPLAAQEEIGVRVGGSLSQVFFRDPEHHAEWQGERDRRGLAAGVSARWRLGERVSAVTEALYVQKGYGGEGAVLRTAYLELPVLLRLDLARADAPARVFVQGGVAASVLLACTGEIFWSDVRVYEGECEGADAPSPELETEELDAGAVLGAGLAARAGGGVFTLEVRHTRGRRNVRPWMPSRNHANTVLAGWSVPMERLWNPYE
jgi:Outer membrane protein beta-barrel domain